jgi:hypothetical protein
VYIVATGGQPSPGTTNSNLQLMTALGSCTALQTTPFITINELTTVAAVNALAPYITSASAIGSGGSDVSALNTAFTLASEYVNPTTGYAPGASVPTGYTVPVAEIDSLGNAAAACVNSSGGTANDGSNCGSFFEDTKPTSSSAPTSTLMALLNLAKNPTLNTAAIYSSSSTFAAFQPTLAVQPTTFAIGLTISSFTLNPSSLAFGTAYVGGSAATQSATLANIGTAAGTVSSVGISGTNLGDFTETNNCPASLAAGAVCTITVTFSPTTTGSRSGTLVVNGSSLSSTLSGTGTTAGSGPVTLSPTSLTFYEKGVPQLVTLTNSGSSTIGIKGFQFSSPNYSEVDNCGSALSGQSVCNIYVSAGSAVGNFTGTMTAVDSDTTDVQTVSLTTCGQYATFQDYGVSPVGIAGESLYYQGNELISYGGGYACYGYVLTPNGSPAYFQNWPLGGSNYTNGCSNCSPSSNTPYPTGQQCSVAITLTPAAAGTTYFEFSDNMGGSYLLKGVGFPTTSVYFNVSPAAVNLGSVPLGSSASSTTTLIGGGGTSSLSNPPTYVSSSVTGVNHSDFSVTPCATFYRSCSFGVTFTPSALGVRTATVTVTYSGINSTTYTQSFLVTGNGGYTAPTLAATTAYGNVQVGTSSSQTITVTMPSKDFASAAVTGTGFALSGATTCAQGASTCQFTVIFTPTAASTVTGSLTVTDMVTGATASSSLTGTGTNSSVSLSPTSLTFSARSVGTQSIAQTVTLTNNGAGPLVISAVNLAGTNPGDYAQTNTCVGTIQASGTCSISVSNTPTFVGASSAYVSIVSNAPSSPNTVPLSGRGQ